jgi:uncharacterized protein YndB with AHSA1/START domain
MSPTTAVTDRIEKRVLLRAPLARVWKAIGDSREFGRWFGATLDGPFVPGATLRGTFAGDLQADAIVDFQKQLGLEPSPVRTPEPNEVFCTVERVEPERTLSFRWIPYGIDAAADPTGEPTTLVEFHLEKAEGGTLLTIVESGFDKIPAHRRQRAFLMNDAGWAEQAKNIQKHVEGN